MIPKVKGWEDVKAAKTGSYEKLPAGGYEAKIISAHLTPNSDDTQRLEIAVDITAGEFKDYFKKQFDSSTFEGKKWKGVARFFLPVEDGSKKDNFKKRLLKAMTEALEFSNANYKWDWDEKKLKGLKVGIMVRDKEYDYQGHYGFFPEIFEFVDIKIIKNGEFSTPEPRYLNGKSPKYPNGAAPSEAIDGAPMPSDEDAPPEDADDDYPF